MKRKKQKPADLNFLFILFPCLIWLLIFSPYLSGGKPVMSREGIEYYQIIKYLMDNLSRGVFPLWNPFQSWGQPDAAYLLISPYNPFLWVYFILETSGLSSSSAFLWQAFFYFIVGNFGFLCLAQMVLKNIKWASVAFSVLLFSSFSFTIFQNYGILLTLVPAIWFFYFTLKFTKGPSVKSLVGITFCLMILATSPHFSSFLIALLAIIVCSIGRKDWPSIIDKSTDFFKQNRIYVWLCLTVLMVVILGEWLIKCISGTEIIYKFSPETGVEYFRILPAFILYSFVICLLFKFHRRKLLLIFCLLVLGWLEMNIVQQNGANVDRSLLYVIPILILCVIRELKGLLNVIPQSNSKRKIFLVIAAHVFFASVLYLSESFNAISSVMLILSLVFYILFFCGLLKSRLKIFWVFLYVMILLGPVKMFNDFVHSPQDKVSWVPIQRFVPQFSDLRRSSTDTTNYKGKVDLIQDHSGFLQEFFTASKDVVLLQKNISQEILEGYTRHKFYAYDAVEKSTPQVDFKRLKEKLKVNENLVFVDGNLPTMKSRLGEAEILGQDSEEFRVTDFDLNFIRFETNFPQKKFVVYNDSFHPQWKAYLNTRRADIYKANAAFKGLWIPSGEQKIELRFGFGLLQTLHGILFFLCHTFFICLLIFWIPREKGVQKRF